MLNSATKKIELNPNIINRVQEIESKIEDSLFVKNELSYLDQVQVEEFYREIEKIYLKYAHRDIKERAEFLQKSIRELVKRDKIPVREFSVLDRELKSILNSLKRPDCMIDLDEARVERFQERIDEIYAKAQPSREELIRVEELIREREELLESA
jgi:chaperonin cofactor prefoldin